jgi:hypothetical protein
VIVEYLRIADVAAQGINRALGDIDLQLDVPGHSAARQASVEPSNSIDEYKERYCHKIDGPDVRDLTPVFLVSPDRGQG